MSIPWPYPAFVGRPHDLPHVPYGQTDYSVAQMAASCSLLYLLLWLLLLLLPLLLLLLLLLCGHCCEPGVVVVGLPDCSVGCWVVAGVASSSSCESVSSSILASCHPLVVCRHHPPLRVSSAATVVCAACLPPHSLPCECESGQGGQQQGLCAGGDVKVAVRMKRRVKIRKRSR